MTTKRPPHLFGIAKGYFINTCGTIGKSSTVFIVMIFLTVRAFTDIDISKCGVKRCCEYKSYDQNGQKKRFHWLGCFKSDTKILFGTLNYNDLNHLVSNSIKSNRESDYRGVFKVSEIC